MESRITIDIKDNGDPFIYIDCRASEDLRDKVLGRFFTRTRGYLAESNPIQLIMHISQRDQGTNRIQAMIETVSPPLEQLIA